MTTSIRAFCFDMDGLIFDTERLGALAMTEAAALQRVELTHDQWRSLVGSSMATTQRRMTEWFSGRVDGVQYTDDWCRIMLDHIHRDGMPLRPGAAEVLSSLRRRGMKLALCTSNARSVVMDYLDVAGMTDAFDIIVTGDMVQQGKPAPDIFLMASQMLGIPPTQCAGVEDSINGVKAIRAAGMLSVMIPDVLPYTPEVAKDVDICLFSLTELEQAIFYQGGQESMTVTERFIKYVQVETTSQEDTGRCPSTDGQWTLARSLVDEMKQLGIADARVDEHGYVYGTIPAKGDHPTRMGLIAHMDTSDGVKGATHPQIIKQYDGKAITLKNGVVIDGFDFLPSLAGQDLIVTDGDSVLGADDKAGVAEIMTLAARLCASDAPEHCTVCIAFTPDEEIGCGADLFDVPAFGADYGYTVDGGALGELEYENFNAAACKVIVHGVNIHPGSAKNQMKNAALIAMEWNSMLPPCETPAHTEGYEGFYHLCAMEGDEELAELTYILRDHDSDKFDARKATVSRITDYLNAKWGEGTVELIVKESYRNMKEMIAPHMDIIDRAKAAFTACGVAPLVQPIRGGTDGARLSFMGLPCPNLSTGGYNFHGRKELITVQAMEKMVDVLMYLSENA